MGAAAEVEPLVTELWGRSDQVLKVHLILLPCWFVLVPLRGPDACSLRFQGLGVEHAAHISSVGALRRVHASHLSCRRFQALVAL
jgi:hypothetical protein